MWYTIFDGGCVTAQFRSASDVDAAFVTQAHRASASSPAPRFNRPSTSGRTGDSNSTRTARPERGNAVREAYTQGGEFLHHEPPFSIGSPAGLRPISGVDSVGDHAWRGS